MSEFALEHVHLPGQLCPACNQMRLHNSLEITPRLPFAHGFQSWIAHRTMNHTYGLASHHISDRTAADYQYCASRITLFFQDLPTEEIHIGHLLEYRRLRALGEGPWSHAVGPDTIRKEMWILTTVMKYCHAWTEELKQWYEPLQPKRRNVRRALMPEEQEQLLAVAASRKEWRIIFWYIVLALQTTASTNELRGLERGDIDLEQGTVQIRSENCKNKYRLRLIPIMTKELRETLECLLDRATSLGSVEPHHALFPFCRGNKYNPSRSMTVSGLKKLWYQVRRMADLPWLRRYDLRHTGITRMAEAGVPIHVMMSYAGHISSAMQAHYTMISLAAKRKWGAVAWDNRAREMEAVPEWLPEFSKNMLTSQESFVHTV